MNDASPQTVLHQVLVRLDGQRTQLYTLLATRYTALFSFDDYEDILQLIVPQLARLEADKLQKLLASSDDDFLKTTRRISYWQSQRHRRLQEEGFRKLPNDGNAQVCNREALGISMKRDPDNLNFLKSGEKGYEVIDGLDECRVMWDAVIKAATYFPNPKRSYYILEQNILYGRSQSEIAREIGVAHNTVCVLIKKIMKKASSLIEADKLMKSEFAEYKNQAPSPKSYLITP